MSTRPSFYYDGYGGYNYPKYFLLMKPLKEKKKKNATLENLTTKKISTGPSMFTVVTIVQKLSLQ